jgi:hypothetical protein
MGHIFWTIIGGIGLIYLTSTLWSIGYEMLNAKYYELQKNLDDAEKYILQQKRIIKMLRLSKEHEEHDSEILKEIEDEFNF